MELSPEAQIFRAQLLNFGGKVTGLLNYCLQVDQSGTNAFIEATCEKWNGQLTTDSALALAQGLQWIIEGKEE